MKSWWPDWAGMFVPDLSLLETFLRVTLVYLGVIALFRLVLKRQTGSLGLPDVTLVVLVSECASPALTANANSVPNGLVAVGTLLFWAFALDRLSERWPWLRRLLEPEPVPLVREGQVIEKHLKAEGVSREELDAQLRLQGLDDVRKAKTVMLESSGEVSVVPKQGGEGGLGEALARLRRAADDVEAALARQKEEPVRL
ncbi:MAG: DUF421 domain-containing protein [Gemmataceae bacterium]|nr:DUF421 domain-containing protein [Gemmataceae bacterium]